jgi:hypothetical protein
LNARTWPRHERCIILMASAPTVYTMQTCYSVIQCWTQFHVWLCRDYCRVIAEPWRAGLYGFGRQRGNCMDYSAWWTAVNWTRRRSQDNSEHFRYGRRPQHHAVGGNLAWPPPRTSCQCMVGDDWWPRGRWLYFRWCYQRIETVMSKRNALHDL